MGGYAGNANEPGRLSLGEFIESLYFKRFRKELPDSVQTIEQLAAAHEEKRADRKAAKLQNAAASSQDDSDADDAQAFDPQPE
jgi:hypothetical protein